MRQHKFIHPIQRIDSISRTLWEIQKNEKKNKFEKQEILLQKLEEEIRKVREIHTTMKDFQGKSEKGREEIYSQMKLSLF